MDTRSHFEPVRRFLDRVCEDDSFRELSNLTWLFAYHQAEGCIEHEAAEQIEAIINDKKLEEEEDNHMPLGQVETLSATLATLLISYRKRCNRCALTDKCEISEKK